MPLIQSKSKKAISKNIETEMKAGKPQDQSIAIAYNVQRKAKKKKMAYGGMAEADGNPGTPAKKPDNRRLNEEDYMGDKWADGGEIESRDPASSDVDDHYDSIADAIRAKKRSKSLDFKEGEGEQVEGYADGGMVDLEEESEEHPNYYDKLNMEAAGKEQYDDSQLSRQPEDSNEHGDDIESDIHDMVESIRRKMKAKRGA